MFNWIINLILGNLPVWIWPALAGAGFVVSILSNILSHIPQFKPFHFFIKPLAILVMVGGIFMYGGAGVLAIEQQAIEEMKAKIAVAEQQSADANALLAQKSSQNTKIIHDTKIVIQKEFIADAQKIDAECKVDPIAIKDLNDAAKNPLGTAK
jgi:hypothetical protein